VIGLLACDSKSKDDSKTKSGQAEEQSVQGKKEAGDSNSVRHELKVRWIDISASYVITINGFPALQEYVQARSVDNEFDVQLNTGLVGEGNKVEIRLEPFLTRSGRSLSIGTIELEAQVLGPGRSPVAGAKITEVQVDSVYEDWSERARAKWKEYQSRTEHGALDSIRAWVERHPLTVSTTFDNEAGPDFSRIFEEAPRLPDRPATRERLVGYAMRLRDLMAQENTSALLEEFRPAIEDRFEALSFSDREKFMQQNREALVLENPVLDFDREDIQLRSWCDGRVWQLIREGAKNEGLLQEPSGTGRGKIYVAEIDGELKVVRQG
jgi:hypothetical protein